MVVKKVQKEDLAAALLDVSLHAIVDAGPAVTRTLAGHELTEADRNALRHLEAIATLLSSSLERAATEAAKKLPT